MAAPIGPTSAPAVSQKQRRAFLRKERRKRKRQAIAQSRKNGNEPSEVDEDGDENEEDNIADGERQRLHEEWLDRERAAQEEFKLKTEREEAAQRRREEEERLIKEEWEARQRKEQEEQEQKMQKKRDREEAVQKRLDEAESQLENGGPWMNPEAPVKDYGTERDVANCPFFLKTGACRFGDRCSRRHVHPTSSTTLLIRSMFFTFGMEQAKRDDYDMDACLEHSEEELREHFIDFYHDVLPEFRSVGTVVQFKVSCNYESHLRGNVYVQFETEEQCKDALIKFNGRWYAGRQLHCELCPVTRWKNAICGLFDRQKCPKGKNCNFLHVFRNPGNAFWEADRDMSPVRGNRREGWHSERRGDRSWRQWSPVRSERSHRGERWREERGSRGRYSERYNRNRSRSRSRDRSRWRSRSREKTKYDRDKGSRSRSKSKERARHKRSRSPKQDDKPEHSPMEDGSPHKRHKHSKKSKKKTKKKSKKKGKESPGTKSTSEDSDKESTKVQSPKTEDKEVDDTREEKEELQNSPESANKKDEEALENSNSNKLQQ